MTLPSRTVRRCGRYDVGLIMGLSMVELRPSSVFLHWRPQLASRRQNPQWTASVDEFLNEKIIVCGCRDSLRAAMADQSRADIERGWVRVRALIYAFAGFAL